LNELFRDVAHIVHEQGDQLDLISVNVDNTRNDTRGADLELRSASKYQKNARNKACCLLLIMAVILIIIVLAVSLG
jgi:t-SNARE complex subunit (syntaxin)